MSRIGRKPIELPTGVTVTEKGGVVRVTGPKGALSMKLSPLITLRQEGVKLYLSRSSDDRQARSVHGLMRNLLANMVTGVSKGFERKLDIVGVGFKAELTDGALKLNLGFSHPVIMPIPQGIDIVLEKPTKIVVRGIDVQQVGQVAANIRAYRPPDNYKGKGIRYEGEVVKLKPGKAAAG